jgi:2,3-bisphosphoglycerate-dependent phosphoglycerate mutase
MPYWSEVIAPAVKDGERTLVAAHEHSLRALVKHLDGLPDEEVVELEIPGGCALVYELDGDLRPARRYYLADPD